ncbi:GNAT family N-acetyltransferase [Pontibacter mangrovi]|uniref:GNAT family N-acetyltransferase n=1 Tax=Pontibacter mangrovi TaxID=2589816 RepID=A0A501W1A0_9BACT|nr:GNAT family N-acetyltransferase [Pontibacter mangrovi]TPE42512.1 GNAT family N-acetyltransferase [Pontibacter mangrovi]
MVSAITQKEIHTLRISERMDFLIGEEVFDILADDRFKQGWDTLYHNCPWATAFQSRGFVCAWYRVFRDSHLPLVVRAYEGDRLTGLLTMAIPYPGNSRSNLENGSVQVMGAGEFEAEYHCWLAGPENGEKFITAALRQILSRLPKARIQFRFIPAGAPLAWLRQQPEWHKKYVLQPYHRPLLNLKAPGVEHTIKLRHQYKTKYNRLQRLGEVQFHKITTEEAFKAALQELSVQYDFRLGALYNKNPFRNKPLKFELMVELFRQGMLHVTVLKLDEHYLASLVAVADRGWVHLQGLNSHSPFFAKYSPGMLHFLSLGNYLHREGKAVFDLTPGDDSYKERFANVHDQVHTLVISHNPAFLLKKKLKKIFHTWLLEKGKRPMSVELALQKKKYQLKHTLQAGLKNMARQQLQRLKPPKPEALFLKTGPSATPVPAVAVKQDSLSDLLLYQATKGNLSRWEFTEKAMRLYENGAHAYTWTAHQKLLACAWVGGELPDGEAEQAIAVHTIYVHPEAKAELAAFLAAVADAVLQEDPDKKLIALCPSARATITHALHKTGFTALTQNL